MENRFCPLGMEQHNRREDDDTEERFSVSGAKIRGCQKDTYDKDDDTEHAGRLGYTQPHQQGETKIFDNYMVKRESNDEGDDPFNNEERSTPSHQKQSNDDKDDNDHLDDPYLWEHRKHTDPTTQSRDSFGGIYLNAN